MRRKHVADTPSRADCPRERVNPTLETPSECKGWVRAWEFSGAWYGRALWADDMVPCPQHDPARYARRLFHGASHKGRKKWWKR